MNELWLFLPGILYLGIVTSYTDIRYGKIFNRDVVIGIVYALAAYIGLLFYLIFTSSVNWIYFAEVCTNAVFALLVAFGLWNYKIWSAGDGKLFFAFVVLIPLGAYAYVNYNWFPSLILLFNIFIIGLVVTVFLILKNANLKNYKKAANFFLKELFNPKKLMLSAAYLFAVLWIVQVILSILGLGSDILMVYLFTVLFISQLPSYLIKSVTNKKTKEIITFYSKGVIISFAIIRLLFDHSIYTTLFLWQFLGLILIWGLFSRVFREGVSVIGKDVFSKQVSIKKLKLGMILSEKMYRVNKLTHGEKKNILSKHMKLIDRGRFTYIFGENSSWDDYLNTESEGLTNKDIKKIKISGIKKITISSTIPFAPILFFGVIATISVGGNIFIVLKFLLF